MKRLTLAVTAILACLCAGSAWAQWGWRSIHPSGFEDSSAGAIFGGKIAGYVEGSQRRAAIWDVSSGNWNNFSLQGADYVEFYGAGDGQYVGMARYPGEYAVLWNGSNWVNLNPQGCYSSTAYYASGGHQVGLAYLADSNGCFHAGLWSGDASSWVDLNPTGAQNSVARAIYGDRQGGAVFMPDWWDEHMIGWGHAALWTGQPDTWQDLNPDGARGSGINDMISGTQVGSASFYDAATDDYLYHAGLWHGTAGSWVDLHPSGAVESGIMAASGAGQVGYTVDATGWWTRASFWQGSAASYVDLHSLLPSYYDRSMAEGIEQIGNDVWVVGWARNTNGYNTEAIVWHTTVPEPASLYMLLVGACGLIVRRKNLGRRKA